MEFGVDFFPTADPVRKSAATYYDECLQLVELAEASGFAHVRCGAPRTSPYGALSPDPVVLLTAAAQRTGRIRLVADLLLSAAAFAPGETAARLAVLDHLSQGRLDVALGWQPDHDGDDGGGGALFAAVEACTGLWAHSPAPGAAPGSGAGGGLPLPEQRPHPPVFVTTAASVQACARAGADGHHLQLAPAAWSREELSALIAAYRAGGRRAQRAPGRVHLTYTCYVGRSREVVLAGARHCEQREAARTAGRRPAAGVRDVGAALAEHTVLAGTPGEVRAQIETIGSWYGSDVCLSLRFNPGHLPYGRAVRAMELFAAQVAPRLAGGVPSGRAVAA
ncbi:LLM class flavin-dependent oxidoreductase [Streptomyces sp. NPDC001904]|uniref:LLM class flavin-dependent oxidoreductase n=1 Tax=Streptomyces sp. NPDC001904 TaxID=3154531 RepID=UPI00331EA18A